MRYKTKRPQPNKLIKKDQENEYSIGLFRKITALTSYQYSSYSLLAVYKYNVKNIEFSMFDIVVEFSVNRVSLDAFLFD